MQLLVSVHIRDVIHSGQDDPQPVGLEFVILRLKQHVRNLDVRNPLTLPAPAGGRSTEYYSYELQQESGRKLYD